MRKQELAADLKSFGRSAGWAVGKVFFLIIGGIAFSIALVLTVAIVKTMWVATPEAPFSKGVLVGAAVVGAL